MLEEYQKDKQTMSMLESQLTDMIDTDAGLNHSVVLDYRDGLPRPQSVVGFDGKLYDQRQRKYEELQRKTKLVEVWIDQIGDERAKCVFQAYYLDKKSWIKIAGMMGFKNNPDYPRLTIRDKYLKENGIL